MSQDIEEYCMDPLPVHESNEISVQHELSLLASIFENQQNNQMSEEIDEHGSTYSNSTNSASETDASSTFDESLCHAYILKSDVCDNDVLLGRGKSNQKHPGNKTYRAIVEYYNSRLEPVKEHEKKFIVDTIMSTIRNSGGRFLDFCKKSNAFYEISTERAQTKIARALRYRKDRDSRNQSTTDDSVLAKRNDLEKFNGLSKNLHKKTKSSLVVSSQQNATDFVSENRDDTFPKDPAAFIQYQAGQTQVSSEDQTMYYKRIIEQKTSQGLLPLFQRNIVSELRRAYEEIELLQAKLKVYTHRKKKMQKMIRKMCEKNQSSGRQMYPHNSMTFYSSEIDDFDSSSSEDSSEADSLPQFDEHLLPSGLLRPSVEYHFSQPHGANLLTT